MGLFGKKKPGSVYFLRSTRPNGTRQTYTGSTTRSVKTRFGEHKRSIGTNSSWVGRGKSVSLIGSFSSRNPRKAEATIKRNRRSGCF
jgi:predicted GIY-YIG superfamily endonuclease